MKPVTIISLVSSYCKNVITHHILGSRSGRVLFAHSSRMIRRGRSRGNLLCCCLANYRHMASKRVVRAGPVDTKSVNREFVQCVLDRLKQKSHMSFSDITQCHAVFSSDLISEIGEYCRRFVHRYTSFEIFDHLSGTR